jgi:hypothetical protein
VQLLYIKGLGRSPCALGARCSPNAVGLTVGPQVLALVPLGALSTALSLSAWRGTPQGSSHGSSTGVKGPSRRRYVGYRGTRPRRLLILDTAYIRFFFFFLKTGVSDIGE